MRTIFSLMIFMLGVLLANAQSSTILDTANTAYRKVVTKYFEDATLKEEQQFELIKDRKVRKDVQATYIEKQEDFRQLIKKGVFIEHAKYSPLIQSVFEKIKKGNPAFNFRDIRLLLAISDEYNAYNYGGGIVVLNLPLLLEMDNEYELAFIISHEISHQNLNHVYNSIVNKAIKSTSKELKKQTSQIEVERYNKGRLAENLFKKLVYGNRLESRKCEHQADSLGFVYFRNAYPEKQNCVLQTLKKLKEIDKPNNDSLVKKDFVKFFGVNSLKFNEEWIVSDISSYTYQKQSKLWNVDSLRTHPDCDLRIDFLKKTFQFKDSDKIPDTNFKKQIESDYEYVFGLYHLKAYGKSLYLTLLKLKQNPEDVFLKKMFYENLLKIRDARNNLTLNKYVEVESPKFSDDYNKMLSLIRNIRKNDLNLIIDFYKS